MRFGYTILYVEDVTRSTSRARLRAHRRFGADDAAIEMEPVDTTVSDLPTTLVGVLPGGYRGIPAEPRRREIGFVTAVSPRPGKPRSRPAA